jgi:uncharacterized membrane protein
MHGTVNIHAANGAARRGPGAEETNVGDVERWLSIAGGGALAAWGLTRPRWAGLLLTGLGLGLVHRGWSGRCRLYKQLGLSTAERHGPNTRVAAGQGCRVEKSVFVNRPADQLYAFWRSFENLPHVMSHLKSVTVTGDRSHWVAAGPAGLTVEWDAEIINDRPNELIAWGSLPGSQVDTAGSVHFYNLLNRGTKVVVNLKYDPPGGAAGAAVAKLFGHDAAAMIEHDIENFKRLAETGGLRTAAEPALHG